MALLTPTKQTVHPEVSSLQQQYQKDGFILHKQPLLDPQQFAELQQIFESLLSSKGDMRADELNRPHYADPRLFKFLTAKPVLDLVESLIGPNIGLWSSHFICKEAFTGRITPWHEDSKYWEGRIDRMDKLATIWLAIDPSSKENGCMRVIPGTHVLEDKFEYVDVDKATHTFSTELHHRYFDEQEAVYFELNPNECSIHDGRIFHGALANASPLRRCGYTMRYVSLDCKVNDSHPDNETHRLYHVRGENVANNKVCQLPDF
ncbi:phytanoyl-CoA dioxygenase family protein [Photobacterium satsumensis]|uniref:phytanoyl-CoA dioxygenase family protein n=1 Tax=Photobacterium satsumensis TaxID=2910239 RepID=UPI003D10449E